jgi:hypothetical protein
MRIQIPCTALGLAVAAFVPAAHAETIVTRQIVTQPVETVRTVTTTRTIRPGLHRRVVVTRRTTVREQPIDDVAPAAAVAAPAPIYDAAPPPPPPPVVATYPQPLYDVVAPAPVPAVAAPVVDVAAPPPLVDEAIGPAPAVPVGTVVPAYRYVYQPDRILVIDPATGIAVQSLPR